MQWLGLAVARHGDTSLTRTGFVSMRNHFSMTVGSGGKPDPNLFNSVFLNWETRCELAETEQTLL